MALLNEEKSKPSLWNQALKAVKGDSTTELVEEFTQEMTLVAEGLCEDQARLRKVVEGFQREIDSQQAKSEQDYQDVLRQMDEHQNAVNHRLEELSRRISSLEKPAAKQKKSLRSLFSGDILGRVTLLVALVCGTWLLVNLLNILFVMLN